jgi:hypothetical protein
MGSKEVIIVDCNDWNPRLPSVILGDRIPTNLRETAVDTLLRDSLNFGRHQLIALNGYLNPLTGHDSVPALLSVILSRDGEILTDYLWRTATSGWGGLLRGRWAYDILDTTGGRILGHYAPGSWALDRERQIRLEPAGPPLAHQAGRAYYAYGEVIEPHAIPKLDSQLLARQQLSEGIEQIYLYATVEQIGFWRGRMEPTQRDGNELHLVPDMARPVDPSAPGHPPGFFAGMTFAHEGYRVFNGYGGSTVGPSLDSLTELGVNAIALVPYTFLRSPDRVGELPVPDDAGSENDGAVCHSIREAHARGLHVMLKPQIWVGGSWPGDVSFATEAEWNTFLTNYHRWIMHYARLADRENVTALCLGTELVRATLDHPDHWREMIAAVRSVYGGTLTYAANWGEEFENLTFWSELDVIGLNSYYPLSDQPNPTDADLQSGAERWMRMADSISRLYDRPLWLTEVGYRSVARSWTNPHAEAGDRLASVADQRRCYEALVAAARDAERLQGMFIWKWPSYLGHDEGRDGRNTGFTPGGKPAAAVVRDFYRRSAR